MYMYSIFHGKRQIAHHHIYVTFSSSTLLFPQCPLSSKHVFCLRPPTHSPGQFPLASPSSSTHLHPKTPHPNQHHQPASLYTPLRSTNLPHLPAPPPNTPYPAPPTCIPIPHHQAPPPLPPTQLPILLTQLSNPPNCPSTHFPSYTMQQFTYPPYTFLCPPALPTYYSPLLTYPLQQPSPYKRRNKNKVINFEDLWHVKLFVILLSL